MVKPSRRAFVGAGASVGLALLMDRAVPAGPAPRIQFGLVTYQWGRDWDLPTLLRNCESSGLLGVELRTMHAHKVEPSLSARQRLEVKKRFADSPVTLVGLGSTQDFHSPDAEVLSKSIEQTKAFIRLSHDVGGTGVKVRPNGLPKGMAVEKTIEQIGKSLNAVGTFGSDYGQQIRLEIHGSATEHPAIIKQIMDIATHPNVALCWNCNPTDLEPPGLEYNFNLLKSRLGATTHVHEFDVKGYPYRELMRLYKEANYQGWWLLEAGGKDPADRVAALRRQKELFEQL